MRHTLTARENMILTPCSEHKAQTRLKNLHSHLRNMSEGCLGGRKHLSQLRSKYYTFIRRDIAVVKVKEAKPMGKEYFRPPAKRKLFDQSK